MNTRTEEWITTVGIVQMPPHRDGLQKNKCLAVGPHGVRASALVLILFLSLAGDLASVAEETPAPTESAPAVATSDFHVYPTAIFAFAERGNGVAGYGAKVSDILFASLVADPNIVLVDREELKKTLDEHELNLSGMVSPDDAIKVGKLIGAKILITGSIIEADKTLYLVAKIIGSETTRVLGVSVKGSVNDEIGPMVESLAQKVSDTLTKNGETVVAHEVTPEQRLTDLKKSMGEGKYPTVYINVEERHVGQFTIDPAAETELAMFCKECGFDVIDTQGSEKQADVVITGEGFSEFATRRGNLVSVKARLEIKAIEKATDKVIAIDRQTSIQVDLTEQIAGKKALQDAAAQLAVRLLPKLVTK